MQYLFFMAVADTFEKLIREALDDHGVHAFFFAEVVHVFLEIVLEILKDEDKFFIGVDDFLEVDDIDMAEFFKDGDFADGRGGNAFFLRLQANLLQSAYLSGLFIYLKDSLPLAL